MSGVTYATLFGVYEKINHPEYLWYTLGGHLILGIVVIFIFTRTAGELKELEE